ncbi:MAG: cadherin-like domain-containing protein [Chromatiales bacterium]|jgi:hypothetical protein
MNRRSTLNAALGFLVLLTGSRPATLWAEEVILEPGWIAGQASAAAYSQIIQTLSINANGTADGTGHTASKSTSQGYTGLATPLEYQVTVQGYDPDTASWDYRVTATATARTDPAFCPLGAPYCQNAYTNIYFSDRYFPVAIGETATHDYAANGTIQFQLNITDISDPATGNSINSWYAYGYAVKNVPAGEERTNSRSYTHSSYTPCGIWDMPVVGNSEVRVYADVRVYGTALRDDLTTYNYTKSYNLYGSAPDYYYVDVGTDDTNQVVVVPLEIEHDAPPPPPIVPPVVYDYGTVEGTVNLNLTVDGIDYSQLLFTYPDSPYSRHYVYGYSSNYIFTNPGDYLRNNVRTGTYTFRARSYLYDEDHSQIFYYWPYTNGDYQQDRVEVFKDTVTRKDFMNETGIMTGKLQFNGSLKTKDLDWYRLRIYGDPRQYESTYGGNSYETVRPTQDDPNKPYRMFLTPGYWQPYYIEARADNSDLLGYSGSSDIRMYDYNYYYNGSYYDFGQPAEIVGGLSTHENLNYKIGGVSMCFEVAGGGSLRSPSVSGNAYLYNQDGKREMSVSVSGSSSPDVNLVPNPEVILYGPEGDYNLSPRAYTEDDTRINFPARLVSLSQSVFKRRCLTSPGMKIDNYEFDLTTGIGTGTATATVSGSATDEDGILRIEFWLDGIRVHLIDYSATAELTLLVQAMDVSTGLLSTSVDFSYDFELTAGLHTIRVVAVDGLGNESYDEWEVEVNAAPVANDDSLETLEETPLNITHADLLANDTDADVTDLLTIVGFTGPGYGELVDNGDGTLIYAPMLDYSGLDSFTYSISDGRGGVGTASVTINVIMVNDPPVAVDDQYSTDEDSVLNVPSSTGLLANDTDIEGDDLSATLDKAPAYGTVLVNTDGSFTYTPNPDYNGPDSFGYLVADGDGASDTGAVTLTVNAVNDPPELAIDTATQSVQYSDQIIQVIVSAVDIDSPPAGMTATWSELPAGLSITGGCSVKAQGSTCEWSLDGQVQVGKGTHPISFTLSDLEAAKRVDTEVIVVPEDASAAFDAANRVSIRVVSDGGNSGLFTLIVNVMETVPDLPAGSALPGDISLADLTMKLVPVGAGGTLTGTCTATTATTRSCSFNGVPVETYTIEVTIDGDHYTGSAEDVLTVYDPSLGFTTGGGWLGWPGTGEKTNFGYTMKYGKKGTNVKGSLLLIRHLADGQKYRIKSNALEGLAVGQDPTVPYGWASFSGKATYLEPGMSEAEGNHGFMVYVEDRDEPGNDNDRFWIIARAKDGSMIPAMSLSEPGAANAVAIRGGNIVVPH